MSNIDISPTPDCAFCQALQVRCLRCGEERVLGRFDDEMERLRAENARLRAALEQIANDPHCSYDMHSQAFESEAERQYQGGVVDGHRCAAQKARNALAKQETSKDGGT